MAQAIRNIAVVNFVEHCCKREPQTAKKLQGSMKYMFKQKKKCITCKKKVKNKLFWLCKSNVKK